MSSGGGFPPDPFGGSGWYGAYGPSGSSGYGSARELTLSEQSLIWGVVNNLRTYGGQVDAGYISLQTDIPYAQVYAFLHQQGVLPQQPMQSQAYGYQGYPGEQQPAASSATSDPYGGYSQEQQPSDLDFIPPHLLSSPPTFSTLLLFPSASGAATRSEKALNSTAMTPSSPI